MREAAEKLHGEHDYRNLCKMDVANGVTNFTRKILSTQIQVLHNRYGRVDPRLSGHLVTSKVLYPVQSILITFVFSLEPHLSLLKKGTNKNVFQ